MLVSRLRGARRVPLVLLLTAAAALGLYVADAFEDEAGQTASGVTASVSASAPSRSDAPASALACGSATAGEQLGVDSTVAKRIYSEELSGTEVAADSERVRSSGALLTALEDGDAAAVYTAVHALVYHPVWHIVRLRVLRRGRTIADVGGPYVIAPVMGTLKRNGRTVGRFVMSVQDDAGFVKLVTRFIGAPVDLFRGGSLLMGTLRALKSAPAQGALLDVSGVHYEASVFTALAFPAGHLGVALLDATAPAQGSGSSCSNVREQAWGSVARHLASRFHPLAAHYGALVQLMRAVTGGIAFVRSGTGVIGRAPSVRVPISGSLTYAGHRWQVFSWRPAARTRVYLLTPAS